MRLKDRLIEEVAQNGPLSVADYMARCLTDPEDGYYATRPALGEDGDFITAPLVSQMFGELLGLWAVEVWSRLGSPRAVRFVEAGPGDGTLMSDMLRAARLAPAFLAAADVVLIETSAPLRKRQAERLSDAPTPVRWADDLSAVAPDRPAILIANELLDCLPARQFVRTPRGWAERKVGLGEQGLAFGLEPVQTPPPGAPDDLPLGVVWETSPAQVAFAAELGARLARAGGAALLIDYGRAAPEPGDTLQALQRHRKVDPLEQPGAADLTVWADFPSVVQAAQQAGAAVEGPVEQGLFLRRLGLDARTEALMRARPERAAALLRQRERLVGADQMGQLFKAVGLKARTTPALPGLEAS